MERGSKALAYILLGALLFGVLIILFKPDYRLTAQAMMRGEVEQSPLWQSNADYYPEVTFEDGMNHDFPE